jgi:hypothetical protein
MLVSSVAWVVWVLVRRRTRLLGLSSVGPSTLLLPAPEGVGPLGRVGLAVLEVVGRDGVLQLGRQRLGSRLAAVVR